MLDWLRHSKRKVRVGKNRSLQKWFIIKKTFQSGIMWILVRFVTDDSTTSFITMILSKVAVDLIKYFILYFCSLSKLSS